MSRTINRVELLGRVGAEPELRRPRTGPRSSSSAGHRPPQREGETQTDWHTVVCWAKQAEAVAEYVQKGERVYVAGRLSSRAGRPTRANAAAGSKSTPPR